ncbi:MAG: HAMP domain-containing protein [Holosporales bacterium]|nr:HAMP domain-containing protein [Holosporales bacterium]
MFGVCTYFILTSENDFMKSKLLFYFLYADIFLLLLLIYITVNRVILIFKIKNKNKVKGSRFQKQIISIFTCVTIVPATCVFLFAVLFFNMGVESLFKAPVKAVIEDANKVADIYIQETRNALENYAYGVGMQLKGVMEDIMITPKNIEEVLSNETSGLGIDAVVFQIIRGMDRVILAKSPFTLSLQFEELPGSVYTLDDGDVISWESKQSAIAVEAINRDNGIYLIVSKNIDPKILAHKHKIKDAVYAYTSMASQRTGLKITFMTFFSCVIALLLAIVVLIGVLFANRVMRPVNKLIFAAKNISLGDYNSPIEAPRFKNELDILISSFNIMIAKLKEQRNALAISNRQNAWRDIARKIAHEIKNPLTPIQLSAERLKRKYSDEIKTDKEIFITCIDTIIRQVRCIGSLVKEFSDFARMPAPKLEDTDIVSIIKETVFIQSSSHRNINFHISLNGNEVCTHNVDSSQMNQVMMNLLQNSINAIEESKKYGNICISLRKREDSLSIVVEDDGPGFSQYALEHALDPYYTTRESGNGLGLAIVYKIVLEHGGQVYLSNSEKFKGASVEVSL